MSHTRNRIGQPQQQYRPQGYRPWVSRNQEPQHYPGEHSGQNLNRNSEFARGSRYQNQGTPNSGGPDFGNRAQYKEQGGYGASQDDYVAQMGYRQMHYPQREEDSDYSFGGEYLEDDGRFRRGENYRRSGAPLGRQSYAGRGPQGYRRSDERITEDINEQLTQDHQVDATGISVETRSGEVVLKGTVTDRASKRRAEEIAESCSGVKDVQNQLRIKRDDSIDTNSGPQRDRSEEKRSKAG